MAIVDDIYRACLVFLGPVSGEKEAVLVGLCKAAEAELCSRLRSGISEEDCRDTFVCAASFLAMASFDTAADNEAITSFTAGELSVNKGSASSAASCLRTQAEMMMAPYCADTFSFVGVRG